jgi:uncharacterized protein (UPF0210 family)
MRIRNITSFVPVGWPLDSGTIASAARLLNDAKDRLVEAGFEVQSTSLATPPFLDVLGHPDPDLLLEYAQALEAAAQNFKIDAVSIGPVHATTPLALLMSIHALPRVIQSTSIVSSGVLFADRYGGVNLAAARALAEAVLQLAQTTTNGQKNLRLAALANIPPFVPFPPAAYHQGSIPAFSIATEAADLALTATAEARSLTDAHKKLVRAIENVSFRILNMAGSLVDDHNVAFKGIDFSLTPSPHEGYSIGAAVEQLGIDAFGGSGTLFAMTFFSNAIRQANVHRIAFSGVMLPVLGDAIIARRAEEGSFSVNDLMLYSAIGGAGLDLVPIPGTTAPDEIAAVYLDMAVLALATNKPLIARLLPVPGKAVGQKIDFGLAELAPGRVIPLKNLGAQKLFDQNSFLKWEK